MALGWLKRADIYRKIEGDFTRQTTVGGLVSLVAIVLMLVLFVTEFMAFLSVEIKTDMYVDDESHVETFDALFSVTIPKLPCASISLDVQDEMGRHDVGIESLLRKRRYSSDGTQLEMHDPESHGGDVAAQYEEQKGEHCNIHGHLQLNKVPGNFHISTHAASQWIDLPAKEVDFAHVIEHLNFGESLGDDFEIPGAFTPLNGRSIDALDENVSYEYFFRIVPTVYITLSGERRTSYQFTYSYKEHKDEHIGHMHPRPPSALFFRYELSPISVRHTETRKPLSSFLISLCAIIGGVFSSLGIVDSLLFHGGRLLKKEELGKLG